MGTQRRGIRRSGRDHAGASRRGRFRRQLHDAALGRGLLLSDLKIINRGIDGTELADALKYVDRLVLRYEPRLVVLYAGDNDISFGKLSEQVGVDFERFVRAVHAKLPQTRILYIGVKPSLLRWIQIDRMRLANQVIRAICERDDRLAFLDFDGLMLGWDEKPRRELFVEDGLHLSPLGYQLWTSVLRPYLTGR
jgi:lysophospholipase L1-like esterase